MQLANHQPLPAKWVSHLMLKMQALYGAKFTQQWQGIDPDVLQAEWAEQLAGFTADELRRGLNACLERPFPPTLPEFLVLCRPPIRPEVAFHEAVYCTGQRRRGERGDWTHPAIFHAAVKVGQHDIMSNSYSQIRARWDRALSDELAKGDWAAVPEAQAALPEPKKTELSDAEARKAMDRLGIGSVVNRTGRDPKAWAYRILENPEGKSHAAIEMARSVVEASS